MERPLNVSIYGSCVLRDMFNARRTLLQLDAYFARTSWISATGVPVSRPDTPSKLTSAFQQKNLERDFRSTVLPQLKGLNSDLLLLDLVDERSGVLSDGKGGYVTNLAELKHSGWKTHLKNFEAIAFGTDTHFDLFRNAARKLKHELNGTELIVFRVTFAEQDIDGRMISASGGKNPKEWNELYSRYYDLLNELGFAVIDVPERFCLSDPNHRWGVAPYHYIPEFYDWIAVCLITRFLSLRA